MRTQERNALVRRLAIDGMTHFSPKRLRAGWSAGIWLRGLANALGNEALPYFREVFRLWRWTSGSPARGADQALPGGVAAHLARRFGFEDGWVAMRSTARYLEQAPLNPYGTFDHVGLKSPLRRAMRLGARIRFTVGPDSLWADSAMMYGWSALQLGLWRREERWVQLAVEHALAFARALQRPSGLFAHARDWRSGELYPLDTGCWLRAHGWMLATLSDMIDEVPDRVDSELVDRYQRAITATLRCQRPEGTWPNVLDAPVGHSPPEHSGTALVTYALARGAARGELGSESVTSARAGLMAVLRREDRIRMTQTTPVRWSSRAYDRGVYAAVTRRWPSAPPHGWGGLLLALSGPRSA